MAAPSSVKARTRRPAARTFLRSFPAGAKLALAIPFVLLHGDFQPTTHVGSVSVTLADVAILAVAVLALDEGRRHGFDRLRAGRWIWLTAAAFLVYVAAASLYPRDAGYASGSHLVTAAKFAEYALLAPAAALLLRRRRDVELLLAAVIAWSVVCSTIAVLQYAGVDIFHPWPAGRRQPSLLGPHELATFSAATLASALAAIAWPPAELRARRAAAVAAVSGVVGLVLSGAVAGGIGIALAAGGLVLVGHHRARLTAARLACGAAVLAVAAAGVVAIRSGDLTHLAHSVGIGTDTPGASSRVQTYSQRALMSYVGYRIWLDHPLVGAGWQASSLPQTFEPYLADAHRRFPNQPPRAFPSRAHPWPIDNAYLQALCELGVLGALLFVGFLASSVGIGAAAAWRAPPDAARTALLGLAWLLVVVGAWVGQGLVAGSPHDAVVWLAVGLVAAGAGARRASAA